MATNNLYIHDKNGAQIRFDPQPLVGMSVSPKRNKLGYYSDEYTLTLNGYIINSGTVPASGNLPPGPFQPINTGKIFTAQNNIRERLSLSPLTVDLNDENGVSNLKFNNVRLESLEFEEGTFFQYCKWSAVLKADGGAGSITPSGISSSGIEDFNDEISIEPANDYGYCYYFNNNHYPITSIYYTYSRTISAVGIVVPSGAGIYKGELASSRAKKFVREYISNKSPRVQVESGLFKYVNEFTANNWQLFNIERTQQEDSAAGSFTITDKFIVAPSGSYAIENFNTSLSSSLDDPYYKISIEGTLKGLTTADVDTLTTGITNASTRTNFSAASGNPSVNAQAAYNHISNSGNFGLSSVIYKRANSLTEATLNSQPLSVSLSNNPVQGEISYNLEFDNRPFNFFENVMSERIEINDTYPGDVFATIPILGRPTGPILQYTFGRTEYKRELSLEVVLDHTWIGYNSYNNQTLANLRASYLYTKPSIRSSFRSQLEKLIQTVSPAQEPGVRRYFLSPPREIWNPKEGRYTLTLEWTYEISE